MNNNKDMKTILILLLLIPMVSFGYDDYDYKHGGGGILPDWFGVIIAIGLVGCLIFGFISLPFWMYTEKKREKEAKIEDEKMRARLKRIGMPEEQITEEEITKLGN